MVIKRTDLQEFMLNSDKLPYFQWLARKMGIVGMIGVRDKIRGGFLSGTPVKFTSGFAGSIFLSKDEIIPKNRIIIPDVKSAQ
jgi:hypothetical protein